MQFSQKAKMKIINIIEQKYIALIFLGGESILSPLSAEVPSVT